MSNVGIHNNRIVWSTCLGDEESKYFIKLPDILLSKILLAENALFPYNHHLVLQIKPIVNSSNPEVKTGTEFEIW